MFKITIDQREVEVEAGESLLQAARKLDIDVPTLCFLEKCGALNSCLVCLVKVVVNGQGRLVPSCGTKAVPGMVVESETEEVHEARRTALELLFSDHVGDCLSPCHRLCPLQLEVPAMIRQIESNQLDQAIRTIREALALPSVLGRLCHHPCEQGCRRASNDDPAAIREMERFVADGDLCSDAPHQPSRKVSTGKSVAVIGAGPAGLAAGYQLIRHGHAVTVVDRNPSGGGTLRSDVPEALLPRATLDAELAQLGRLGMEFKFGIELGREITLEGLLRGFDAVLLTIGALRPSSSASSLQPPAFGLALGPTGIKADPNTCQSSVRGVFAAGSVIKPVKQLVKAMAEGKIAAECIHQFLNERDIRRPDKPFSSIMGRLDPSELKLFLQQSSPHERVSPCDACKGFKREEARTEASRCLHCDCRSSGNCVLQHYAHVYGVDANRFRSERRSFEQYVQPSGVIFEPGKCILCGICVRLAEMEKETLGLAFIGRGFDVRVGVPFNKTIEEGLQKIAEECVNQCPTGALTFAHQFLKPLPNRPSGAA